MTEYTSLLRNAFLPHRADQQKQRMTRHEGEGEGGYRALLSVTLSLAARADMEVRAALTVVCKIMAILDAPYTGGRRITITPDYQYASRAEKPSPWEFLLSGREEEDDDEAIMERTLEMCEEELAVIGESIQATLMQVVKQTMENVDSPYEGKKTKTKKMKSTRHPPLPPPGAVGRGGGGEIYHSDSSSSYTLNNGQDDADEEEDRARDKDWEGMATLWDFYESYSPQEEVESSLRDEEDEKERRSHNSSTSHDHHTKRDPPARRDEGGERVPPKRSPPPSSCVRTSHPSITKWGKRRGGKSSSHNAKGARPHLLQHAARILEDEGHSIAAARIELTVCKEEVRASRRRRAFLITRGGVPSIKGEEQWRCLTQLIHWAHQKEQEEEAAKQGIPAERIMERRRGEGGWWGSTFDGNNGSSSTSTAGLCPSIQKNAPTEHLRGSPTAPLPVSSSPSLPPAAAASSGMGNTFSLRSVPSPPPIMKLGMMTGSKHFFESVMGSVSQTAKDANAELTKKMIEVVRWGKTEGEGGVDHSDSETSSSTSSSENQEGKRGWKGRKEGSEIAMGRRSTSTTSTTARTLSSSCMNRALSSSPQHKGVMKDESKERRRRKKKGRGELRGIPLLGKVRRKEEEKEDEIDRMMEDGKKPNTVFSPLPSLLSYESLPYTPEEAAVLTQEHASLQERQRKVFAEDAVEVEAAVQDLAHLNSLVSEAVVSQRDKFTVVLKNTEEAQLNLKKAAVELEKPLQKFWNARRQLIALLWWCIFTLWAIHWLLR